MHNQRIATDLKIAEWQVAHVVELLDAGNTLPFIARYRKERTGSLDEDQLRQIQTRLDRLRALDSRRETILKAIEAQDALTDALRQRIASATTLTELDDLYQPYKRKRKTRASRAREAGLDPLAQLILTQARTSDSPDAVAADYVNATVTTPAEALAGARDIVAETISDDADVRGNVRQKALRYATLTSQRRKDADDPKGIYRTYYDFSYRVGSIRPYQVLALNRGEAEDVLKVGVTVETRDWYDPVKHRYRSDPRSPFESHLELAIQDAATRLLLPAIERDVRRNLTETAEDHAIEVFAENLRGLLTQPPLSGHTVIGLDPAYRTGTKTAVLDPTGKVLTTTTIYPHAPQNRRDEALATLDDLIDRYGVTLIAIGNGTASRETEALAADLTRERQAVHYLIVNEAGASVYSASELARAELPDLDVSLRGAVSIARRAQDPLAELVKIDPQSIGVGLYQHDLNQKRLGETLETVVVSVVNRVGVDLNTASPALLTYVSGIGPKLAESIVAHRDAIGHFPSRQTLKAVSGLGPKAFEQSAGFLRVRDGDQPLDASAIHPESYPLARQVMGRARIDLSHAIAEREAALKALPPLPELAQDLDAGLPTLKDIVEQLIRPGRDPREDLPAPILRSDVLKMEDLQVGMVLAGTVRNVVDFGAFVDIGVKQDGLLHRSQIPGGESYTVGDVIDVVILNVDSERERISLGAP
jgi:protein Tex